MALVSLLIEKTVLDEAKAQKLISVKGAFHLEMREMCAFHFEMHKPRELMTESYQGRPVKYAHFDLTRQAWFYSF